MRAKRQQQTRLCVKEEEEDKETSAAGSVVGVDTPYPVISNRLWRLSHDEDDDTDYDGKEQTYSLAIN